MRPKVAFFDFACCEGCQLQVANLGETLLDVLDAVEVVEFREVMSEKHQGIYDIAIIEGSITTREAEEMLKNIRARSKKLIAYGSCATIGGVNGMKNAFKLPDVKKEVYGDKADLFDSIPTKSVPQVVPVDYLVHGCPIYPQEFIRVLKNALMGLPYDVPDKAVCVECRFNENICFYERGINCLGPITRAGCNSWCINNGNICYGCRGMLSNPNETGAMEIMKAHNLTPELVKKKMRMYNEATREENE